MYIPASFHVDDTDRLQLIIRRYPFALLLSVHDGGIVTTHLPFLLDPERGPQGVLLAHMARANSHWRLFDGNRESLVVFTGPHSYISPSWYENPVTVPTWNYVTVHAHGRPTIINEKSRVRALLDQLVDEHEAKLHPHWSTKQADAHVQQQLEHIVEFEMEITHMEGKFKLSQNRSRGDQQNVAHALEVSENPLAHELAAFMHRQLEQ